MDCERCESLLVDYVSGELPEADAAELRAALEVCEHCRLALGKLERGAALARAMPRAEPPAAMLAAVMRIAEARAAELAREEAAARVVPLRAPATPRVASADDEGGLEGVWRWLASLLHGPQFAMAALLVLMVGVGLWWVPALSGPRAIPPPLVSDTPPATGPSASLEPVAVPHLEIDPRTGRVLPSEEPRPAGVEADPGPPTRVASAEVVERTAGAREAEAELGLVLAGSDVERAEAEAASGDLAAVATVELGTGDSIGGRAEMGPLPPMPSAPATAPGTAVAPSTPRASGGSSGGGSPGGGSERVAPSALDDDADSVPAPAPDESMLPASLHTQARLLARSGSLTEAARAYERLLTEHTDYASAPRAMVELAEVYRRAGSLSSARSWLERAARYPSVASDARRELSRLDALDRAAAMDLAESGSAAGAETDRATTAPSSEY